MKKLIRNFVFLTTTLVTLFSVNKAEAREGFSLGLQGIGNFFLTHSDPDLSMGGGFGIMVDYRFNQHWSLEGDLFFSFHDGRSLSTGDDGMVLMGLPLVSAKYYFLSSEDTRIDPYAIMGLGLYFLTDGDINNDSGGVGFGGNFGAGCDFYVLDRLSLGVAAKFRPIALVQGNSQSTGIINFGLEGNVVWHF